MFVTPMQEPGPRSQFLEAEVAVEPTLLEKRLKLAKQAAILAVWVVLAALGAIGLSGNSLH